jgi:hypothetical protein
VSAIYDGDLSNAAMGTGADPSMGLTALQVSGAMGFAHDFTRKPVPTFRDHAVFFEHDLTRKPVPTFRDHAVQER